MNPTTIKSGNTHLQLTGEIRIVQTGEWYYGPGGCFIHYMGDDPTVEEYPILREVEPPKPFPVEYPENGNGGWGSAVAWLDWGVLWLDSEDTSATPLTRDNAIDLARRILEHYGVSE